MLAISQIENRGVVWTTVLHALPFHVSSKALDLHKAVLNSVVLLASHDTHRQQKSLFYMKRRQAEGNHGAVKVGEGLLWRLWVGKVSVLALDLVKHILFLAVTHKIAIDLDAIHIHDVKSRLFATIWPWSYTHWLRSTRIPWISFLDAAYEYQRVFLVNKYLLKDSRLLLFLGHRQKVYKLPVGRSAFCQNWVLFHVPAEVFGVLLPLRFLSLRFFLRHDIQIFNFLCIVLTLNVFLIALHFGYEFL